MPTLPLLTRPSVDPSGVAGPQPIRSQAPISVNPVPGAIAGALGGLADVASEKFEQAEVGNLTTQLADFETKMGLRYKEQLKNAIPDGEGGFVENPKGDAWDDEFIKEFSGHLDNIGAEVQSPKARQYYNQMRARLNSQFTEKVAAGRQAVTAKKSELQVQKMLQSYSVSAFNSPKDFNITQENFRLALDQLVEAGKLSPVAADELFQDNQAPLAESAILGRIKQNPERARQELVDGVWDDVLASGKQKARFLDAIDTKLRARASKVQQIEQYRVSNPWKYAEKRGDHPGFTDIKTMSVDSAIERFNFVKQYRSTINNAAMPMFDPQEIQQFTNDIESLNPQQAAQLMAQLDEELADPKIKAEFGKSVFGVSKANPQGANGLAVAFATANEDPNTTRLILAGRRVRKTDKTVKLPTDFQVEFDALLDVNTLAHAPARVRAGYAEAVMDHYIGSGSEQNFLSENLNTEEFRKSFRAIVGPNISVNGYQTMSFRSETNGEFVDEDRFDELRQVLLDKKKLSEIGIPKTVAGTDARVDKGFNRIRFTPSGDGTFFLLKDGFEVLLNDEGGPYELNLKQLDKEGYTPNQVLQRKARQRRLDIENIFGGRTPTPEELRKVGL